MNWLFWSLFVPVVLALLALSAGVSWLFAHFLKDVQQDAAFVPPAVTPVQVLSGAEAYERSRELLALTESSALPSRQPRRTQVH